MRNFEIGDEVEFEVIYNGRVWHPRWNCDRDDLLEHHREQGSVFLATGKVDKADNVSFQVKPDYPYKKVMDWGWNQPGQQLTAYGKSGYLRLIENKTDESPPKEEETCICSSIDLFNYGCRCGGK